ATRWWRLSSRSATGPRPTTSAAASWGRRRSTCCRPRRASCRYRATPLPCCAAGLACCSFARPSRRARSPWCATRGIAN
ncbi:hypothetical protein M885DRAFT_625290, partial [Pelagophyceae sp. CCMP2097]